MNVAVLWLNYDMESQTGIFLQKNTILVGPEIVYRIFYQMIRNFKSFLDYISMTTCLFDKLHKSYIETVD